MKLLRGMSIQKKLMLSMAACLLVFLAISSTVSVSMTGAGIRERVVSQELQINPNTAHKIVAALVAQGVLVTTPAVGSVVAEQAAGDRAERAELLGADLERVVVEAKKLGLTLDEVQAGLAAHWKKLGRK